MSLYGYDIGEALGIASFVDEYKEPLIADFQREYGLDLEKEIQSGISIDRMTALIKGIGPDSAVYRAAHPASWWWTPDLEMNAVMCELIDALDRHFIQANSESGRAPKPIRISRPGQSPPPEEGMTMDELKQSLPEGSLKVVASGH